MTSSEKQKLITHYLDKRKAGMSMTEMKEELKERINHPTDLRHFVSEVDDLYIDSLRGKSGPFSVARGGQFKMWGGILLFLLGTGLTTISLLSDNGLHGVIIIWHGAILTGLMLYYKGRGEMKRTDRSGRVRESVFDRYRKHRL